MIDMLNMGILARARKALRIKTVDFDDQITDLIESACLDLGIAGVEVTDKLDPILRTAIITYVRMHFGQPDDYDRLKESYDEQKAQLATATGYTVWGE